MLLIIQNWPFFLVPAWLPKRPILGRNRNFMGSPCLLSTISLICVRCMNVENEIKLILTLSGNAD